jgi:hypothetical protein
MLSSIIKKSHINIIKFVSFSSLKTNQKKSLLNPILTWPAKQLTLIESYNYALKFLKKNNIPEAEDSSRYLICDITSIGYRYSDFNNNQNLILTKIQLDKYGEYLNMRINRIPVQYIIGFVYY